MNHNTEDRVALRRVSVVVNVKKDVRQVGDEFQKRGILVGRKFPLMNEWLRVSVGTEDEMDRFMKAFKEIFSGQKTEVKSGA